MLPPHSRINHAETRIQKIQIPIQVPVLKPVYVQVPYPVYIPVPGPNRLPNLLSNMTPEFLTQIIDPKTINIAQPTNIAMDPTPDSDNMYSPQEETEEEESEDEVQQYQSDSGYSEDEYGVSGQITGTIHRREERSGGHRRHHHKSTEQKKVTIQQPVINEVDNNQHLHVHHTHHRNDYLRRSTAVLPQESRLHSSIQQQQYQPKQQLQMTQSFRLPSRQQLPAPPKLLTNPYVGTTNPIRQSKAYIEQNPLHQSKDKQDTSVVLDGQPGQSLIKGQPGESLIRQSQVTSQLYKTLPRPNK